MSDTVTLEPIAVKRSTAAKLLDCGSTKVFQLQKAGELKTVKVGADDRIIVQSIREYVARQLAGRAR